tara:strand:+ start:1061 stop:1237 length:177 start_codon:yes stop_codon:yes gene_type:complete
MNITSAQYKRNMENTDNTLIEATVDGKTMYIPLDPKNRHYAEILKQVEEGTLKIEDAD